MPERFIAAGIKERYFDGFTPIEYLTTSRDFAPTDGGKFLIYQGTSSITLTIPNIDWEKDFEINVLQVDVGAVTIASNSEIKLVRAGNFNTHILAGKGCGCFLKLINKDTKTWYLAGNFD